MQIEYSHYDVASNDKETKEAVSNALNYNICAVSVLPQYVKQIKKNLPKNVKLSTVIDYPFGLSSSVSRETSIKHAIDNGADILEVVSPNYELCNRKYDKFRSELDNFNMLCYGKDIELRYVLEYKIYTLPVLQKVAQILSSKNILNIYPSTSFLLDNISDNILVSMLIMKKNPGINVIVNGQAWTDKHIDLITSNKQISIYKTSNIHTLASFF